MKIAVLPPLPRPSFKPAPAAPTPSCSPTERVALGLMFLEGATPVLGTMVNGFAMVFGAEQNGWSTLGAVANAAGTAALMGGIPGGKLAAAGLLGLSGLILAHTATTSALDN